MFFTEGEKAVKALRMMLRQTAACPHKVATMRFVDDSTPRHLGAPREQRGPCDACLERDYQAALYLAERDLEAEALMAPRCGGPSGNLCLSCGDLRNGEGCGAPMLRKGWTP